MSTVLWCTLQNDPEDYYPNDLAYIYEQIEDLDQLCAKANAKPISGFLDDTDLQFNLSEEELNEQWLEEHARWFNPNDLFKTVSALIEAHQYDDEIQEELSEIKARCLAAIDMNTKVRLLIVM